MKLHVVTLVSVIFLVALAVAQAQIKHKFLAVDNGKNKLMMIDQIKNNEWIVDIPKGSRDISLLEGNKILVSHGNGAAEYDLVTGKKLDWAVTEYSSINSARRLDNGNTLLCTNKGLVTEIDANKNKVGSIQLEGNYDSRLIRLLPSGNILINQMSPYRVSEADRKTGKIVWNAELPGKGYKNILLPNGNIMGTTYTAKKVVEVNRAGEIVREWGVVGDKNKDAGIVAFSGFDTLSSGNIVVANWHGGYTNTGPHLVELDKENNLVWSWEDDRMKQITNVFILDDSKGGVPSSTIGSSFGHAEYDLSINLRRSGGLIVVALPERKDYAISLNDISGRKLFSDMSEYGQALYISTSSLPSGMYWIQVEAGHRLVASKRFVFNN